MGTVRIDNLWLFVQQLTVVLLAIGVHAFAIKCNISFYWDTWNRCHICYIEIPHWIPDGIWVKLRYHFFFSNFSLGSSASLMLFYTQQIYFGDILRSIYFLTIYFIPECTACQGIIFCLIKGVIECMGSWVCFFHKVWCSWCWIYIHSL